MTKPRRLFQGRLQKKQNYPEYYSAILGDKNGIVDVPNLNGWVYVQVDGVVMQAYCNASIARAPGTSVIVGRDEPQRDLFRVLDIRSGAAANGLAPYQTSTHAAQHQWLGSDVVYTHIRQFLPLRPYISGDFKIAIYADRGYFNGALMAINAQEIELIQYVPADAGYTKMVLLTLNTSGTLTATAGADVLLANLAITDVPAPPAGTIFVIGAVRLFYGQLQINEALSGTDLLDLRYPYWQYVTLDGLADVDTSTTPPENGLALIWDSSLNLWVPGLTGAGAQYANTVITTDGIVGTVDQWVNGATQRVSAVVSKTVAGTTYQVYAYWDSDGYMCFAKRNISTASWTIYTTAIQITAGWDAHNTINLGLDEDGYIHVAYDNHDTPLKYRKSTLPIATFAGVLSAAGSMLGTHETELTYPLFINDPDGALYITFRDGAVGYGDQYLYKYDHDTTTWAAVTGSGTAGIIIDGKTDGLGVYLWKPCFDSDFGSGGFMHLFWTWNPDPGNDQDFDIAHMRWDGTNWTTAAGAAQPMPADSDNYTQVLNLPVGSGILHQGHSASDSTGHPHLAYIRQGTDTYYHIYHLWYNGASWVDLQITTTAWNVWATNIRPDIAIDRATDKVYIIYVDALERAGLLAKVSAAADYTSWSSHRLWGGVVGYYEPTHDPQQWAENTTLYIPVANDDTGVITMVVYQVTPAAFHHITHETGGSDEIGIDGLTGRAATSQYITIQDEGVSQGQAHTLNVEGGASIAVAAGVATLTLSRWEPLTNGDPDNPEIIFDGGDVLMVEVSN